MLCRILAGSPGLIQHIKNGVVCGFQLIQSRLHYRTRHSDLPTPIFSDNQIELRLN